jgi:hypothetical protein
VRIELSNKLDPKRADGAFETRVRVENAQRRARAALDLARYHDSQAAAARATAETLARAWGFDLEGLESDRSS